MHVHGARLLQYQAAHARVLRLGGLQYIAKRVEFLEQALAAGLLGRATMSAIHIEIQYGSMWATCMPLMTWTSLSSQACELEFAGVFGHRPSPDLRKVTARERIRRKQGGALVADVTQHIGQVGQWVHLVRLTAFHQAVVDGGRSSGTLRADE